MKKQERKERKILYEDYLEKQENRIKMLEPIRAAKSEKSGLSLILKILGGCIRGIIYVCAILLMFLGVIALYQPETRALLMEYLQKIL